MRIASTMMSHNYLKQLNGTYEQYAKLMEQSDGSKLHRASDDAVGYSKYLRYQNNKISNEQYQDNVSTATSWMKNADAALVNVTGLLITFKAKTEQAANSTNNTSDWQDIAKELLANVQEQVADLNTQIGDRFLFAGQKDTTMPFSITDEKMDRGETRTLDEKQQFFFSGADWGDENTTMKQMLKLEDEDGAVYYMNVQNGDIYTEDFVVNGYKNSQNANVVKSDSIACADEYRYDGKSLILKNETQQKFFGCKELKCYTNTLTGDTYYADDEGNLYKKNDIDTAVLPKLETAPSSAGSLTSSYTQTGNPPLVLNETQKAYYGVDTLQEYSTVIGGTTYYAYADANGNLYNVNDVRDFVALTTPEPASESSYKATDLASVNNFRISDFFDTNGVINTAGSSSPLKGADGNTLLVNGKELHFSTVKQYIVKYNGDDKYISMVKKNGGVDQATDTVNVTGQDINGTDIFDVGSDPASGTAMLNQLMYTVAKVEACDYHWAGQEGMTIADTAHATVLGAETKMAARQQAYTAASGMLTTQNESITSDITDVSSTDVAYLATKLMEYQTIYSMSLSVGSKILPGSLADYLN